MKCRKWPVDDRGHYHVRHLNQDHPSNDIGRLQYKDRISSGSAEQHTVRAHVYCEHTMLYWMLLRPQCRQSKLGTCEASRFDSNSNRTSRFEFYSKVTCRFENFESAAHVQWQVRDVCRIQYCSHSQVLSVGDVGFSVSSSSSSSYVISKL